MKRHKLIWHVVPSKAARLIEEGWQLCQRDDGAVPYRRHGGPEDLGVFVWRWAD